MNRTELEHAIATQMRADGVRKHVSFKPDDFYIRLGDGKESRFCVDPVDKEMLYTQQDVRAVLDACFEIIRNEIERGNQVTVFGLGSFILKKHKSTEAYNFGNGKKIIPEHYVLKFTPGVAMKRSVKLLNLSAAEAHAAAEAADVYIGGA